MPYRLASRVEPGAYVLLESTVVCHLVGLLLPIKIIKFVC